VHPIYTFLTNCYPRRPVLSNVFNISVRAEEKNFSSARLRPWSQFITLSSGDKLCGDDDDNLYLLYSGEVQVQERDGSRFECFTGSFFNLDRLLVSVGALSGLPSTLGAVATHDSTVLAVSRTNFLSMQRQDPALAHKLLLTLLAQKEANRPGRTRARAPYRVSSESSDEAAPVHGMAQKLLAGDDYKISLTDAQIARFGEVFDLVVEPGQTEIPMDRFSNFVSMEARLLGSGKHNSILGGLQRAKSTGFVLLDIIFSLSLTS
jgi:CRP-like cAMP-binding protein